MHRRERAWKAIMWGSDCTQGLYPPHWADGWPSKIEHRMTEWQDILSRLPAPPTSEQLDDYYYGNAKRFMEVLRRNRGEGEAPVPGDGPQNA